MPNNYPQPAVFLQSGNPNTENRPQDSYSAGELGSRFVVKDKADSDIAKGYQLVIVDSAMDVAPSDGAVAYWRNRTGYLVTTDVSVAGRGNVAGVFRTDATVDYVCCIQQQGRGSVQPQSGLTASPTDMGLIAIPSATDAKADVLAAGSAATYPALGRTLSDVQPATGLFAVELDVPARP